MQFDTKEEAEEWFFLNVYKGEEKDELFKREFKIWIEVNDIVILDEMIEDFTGTGDITGETR